MQIILYSVEKLQSLVKFVCLAKHIVLLRAIPFMSVIRKNRNGKKYGLLPSNVRRRCKATFQRQNSHYEGVSYVNANPAMSVGRPRVNWTTPCIHGTALDIVWR